MTRFYELHQLHKNLFTTHRESPAAGSDFDISPALEPPSRTRSAEDGSLLQSLHLSTHVKAPIRQVRRLDFLDFKSMKTESACPGDPLVWSPLCSESINSAIYLSFDFFQFVPRWLGAKGPSSRYRMRSELQHSGLEARHAYLGVAIGRPYRVPTRGLLQLR